MKLAQWLFTILEGLVHPESTHAPGLGRLVSKENRSTNGQNLDDFSGLLTKSGRCANRRMKLFGSGARQ